LERGGGCRVLMNEPEGKRTLERPRRRWEDNIKMDIVHLSTNALFIKPGKV
jgi:hypothetical protein